MIKIENLGFSYGDNVVLRNITMTLEEGRIYGLLGENGVGKTTLLTLLCGLKQPKAGEITIDGHTPYKREPSFLSDQYYLSDEVSAINMRAEEYAKSYGKFWDKFDMGKFLEIMEIFENDASQKMNRMSSASLRKLTFHSRSHAIAATSSWTSLRTALTYLPRRNSGRQ